MSEPIKVGDLVAVKKACCIAMMAHPIFTVGGFESFQGWRIVCRSCLQTFPDASFATVAGARNSEGEFHVPISWLKRIPPLSELDDVKHDEEITA
jgi:hypothetical protein